MSASNLTIPSASPSPLVNNPPMEGNVNIPQGTPVNPTSSVILMSTGQKAAIGMAIILGILLIGFFLYSMMSTDTSTPSQKEEEVDPEEEEEEKEEEEEDEEEEEEEEQKPVLRFKNDTPDAYEPLGVLAHTDTGNPDGTILTGIDKYLYETTEIDCYKRCFDNPKCKIYMYDFRNNSCLMGTKVGSKLPKNNRYSNQALGRKNIEPPASTGNWTKDDPTLKINKFVPHSAKFPYGKPMPLIDCKKACEAKQGSDPKCNMIRVSSSNLNCILGNYSISNPPPVDTNPANTEMSSYRLT